MGGKVLLIGLGNLGSVVLELLARTGADLEIVTATRNAERGEKRCNLARAGAVAQGFCPSIRNVRLDLDRIEEVAATVRREKPDVIFSTATMQTWWLPDLLPSAAAIEIRRAGFGVWLPVHLAPSLKLMRAVKLAEYPGHTVLAPYPDVVNCVLARAGMVPTCGVGNIDEIAVKARIAASERLRKPLEAIEVTLVAHHAVGKYVFREQAASPAESLPPFLLRLRCDGADVTGQLDTSDLVFSPFPMTEGPATHFFTAGATVPVLLALLSEKPRFLHVPGPHGLPGGYPVQAASSGISLALGEIPLERAVSVNEKAQVFDGIERIEPDGTVLMKAQSADALQGVLGYAPRRVSPVDAEQQAKELVAKFDEYAKRQGVRLEKIP